MLSPSFLPIVATPWRLLLLLAFALAPLAVPTPTAAAHELEKEMKKMGRAFREVREAEDPFEQIEPLEVMRERAQGMLEMAPHDADEEDHKEFLQGIEKLLGHIDEALLAANDDEASAVAAALKEMRALRKKYHEYFEVDDD